MERKLAPQFTKSIEDRTVTGIFAVHGHVDDGQDRSWPGSLANIAINGRKRARFLWMHNGNDPPIAIINDIRELSRDELPTSVLTFAPDTTGGAQITRTYLDTPRGNEILTGLKAGAIEEMSYGYNAVKFDFETTDDLQIRNLRLLELWDVSDVNWGMQEATTAVKSGLLTGLPLTDHSQTVLAAIEELHERYAGLNALRTKEGRTFSAANMQKLTSLKESLAGLLADLEALLLVPEKGHSREDLRHLRAISTDLRLRSAYVLGAL